MVTTYIFFELLSCKHDADSIGSILGLFRHFSEADLRLVWPCVGLIVTDCSFAMIHAIMVRWNHSNLDKYLIVAFQFCIKNATHQDIAALVILRLCRNHWVKTVCDSLNSHSIGGTVKTVIVKVMANLMERQNLNTFENNFRHLTPSLYRKVKHFGDVKAFRELGQEE